METKLIEEPTQAKQESLARDIARSFKFVGVPVRIASLRLCGVVVLAASLLGMVYGQGAVMLTFCGVYAVVSVVVLMQASPIDRAYRAEFAG